MIEFKVETSWININALGNVNNVYLSRFNDGKWQKLDTLTAGIDGNYQKYIASTPGFSYFAISADKNAVNSDEEYFTENDSEENETETEEGNETITTLGTVEENKKSAWGRFTGAFTNAVTNIYSTQTLWILGGVVLISSLFLYLRFNRNISRTGKLNFFKSKISGALSLFGLFRIFNKGNVLGKWEDVSEKKTEAVKAKEDYKHSYDFGKKPEELLERERPEQKRMIEKKEGLLKGLLRKEKEKEDKYSIKWK